MGAQGEAAGDVQKSDPHDPIIKAGSRGGGLITQHLRNNYPWSSGDVDTPFRLDGCLDSHSLCYVVIRWHNQLSEQQDAYLTAGRDAGSGLSQGPRCRLPEYLSRKRHGLCWDGRQMGPLEWALSDGSPRASGESNHIYLTTPYFQRIILDILSELYPFQPISYQCNQCI